MSDRPMTRAAAMALGDEKRLVQQGYEFLDEKRMILATRIMRLLDRWSELSERRDREIAAARLALAETLKRRGLEEIQVWPVDPVSRRTALDEKRFLGVTLVEIANDPAGHGETGSRRRSPPDIAACAEAFANLSVTATAMAAVSGNLHRLADEYRRTERRARALENVLLPEINADLKLIEEQLELMDQEETVRVRLAR